MSPAERDQLISGLKTMSLAVWEHRRLANPSPVYNALEVLIAALEDGRSTPEAIARALVEVSGLKPTAAAKALGLSPRTVRRWARAGDWVRATH